MTSDRRRDRNLSRPYRALRRLSVAEARKRPLRVLVTLATVALGAAALTSALTLGASVETAVENGIAVEFTNVDVLQRSDQSAGEDSANAGPTGSSAIAPRDLAKIRTVEGVQELGTVVRTTAAAQTVGIARGISLESLNTNPVFVWQRWSEGQPPQSSTEVALSERTLDELRIGLGDAVGIGNPAVGVQLFTVVGIVDTRGSLDRLDSMYGIVTAEVAERLAGIDGPNTVVVGVDPSVATARVVDEINRVAPIGLPQSIDDIMSARRAVQLGQTKALSAVVAALAGVSCLIAAITSATTSAASLATRRRTWALARCVGASRRHIGGLVAAEALILGLLGSVLGLLAGLGLARLALPLVGLIPGLPRLREDSFTVTATALLLPVVISVALALAGAVVPVLMAARIPPSAALKATSKVAVKQPGRRILVACGLLAAGTTVALLAAGVSASWTGVGTAVMLLAAVMLLNPLFVAAARFCARRSRSVSVRLGFMDVVRRPRAAAIEAVAVFLAVGMISLSWVALGSIEAATSERLSTSPSPDLTVGAVVGSAPIAGSTVQRVRDADGVAAAVAVRFGEGITIRGKGKDGPVSLAIGTAGGDAEELSEALPYGLPVDELRDDTVYVEKSAYPPFFPKSRVTVIGGDGRVANLKIRYVEGLGVPTLVSSAVLSEVSEKTQRRLLWIALEPGADRARVVDEITGIAVLDGQLPVSGPIILDIRVASALSTARAAAVAILAVAVLVAVIGAAATAALSISERAREHATLRALGLDRVGLSRLLVTRVLFVGSIAAALGVLVGGAIGVVASRAVLSKLTLDPRVDLPFVAVISMVVVTVLAVRVAALIPMERASYIPPSRALAQS